LRSGETANVSALIRLFLRQSAASLTCASLSVMLAACSPASDSPRDAERSDSAGVSVVLNSGIDRHLHWNYRAVQRLGGEDSGPASFYQVARNLVSVDDKGDIVVLDRNAFRAVEFTSSGEFLFEAGREGEGPGEFKRPVGIAAARDGGLAVLDAARGRYVQFDASGQLVEEIPARSFYSYFHLLDAGVVSKSIDYLTNGSVQRLLLSQVSDTTILAISDTGRTNSYQFEGCGPGPRMTGPVIFAPELVWHGNWNSIAVNSEPGYVVNMFDATGRLVRSVRRDIPVEPATAALAVQWAVANPSRVISPAGECIIDPDQVVEKRGFARFVPLVGAVRLAPEGTLWVQRSAFVADSGKIDVFDVSGQYVGTLPVGSRLPIGFTPSGSVLLVERDEFDVERVVVAEIDGRASG
jgi:hypothetical protein